MDDAKEFGDNAEVNVTELKDSERSRTVSVVQIEVLHLQLLDDEVFACNWPETRVILFQFVRC